MKHLKDRSYVPDLVEQSENTSPDCTVHCQYVISWQTYTNTFHFFVIKDQKTLHLHIYTHMYIYVYLQESPEKK